MVEDIVAKVEVEAVKMAYWLVEQMRNSEKKASKVVDLWASGLLAKEKAEFA